MKRLVMILAASLCLGGLTACEEQGPFEEAGEQADEALEEAGEKADEALEDAGDAIEDAADEIEDATDPDAP